MTAGHPLFESVFLEFFEKETNRECRVVIGARGAGEQVFIKKSFTTETTVSAVKMNKRRTTNPLLKQSRIR